MHIASWVSSWGFIAMVDPFTSRRNCVEKTILMNWRRLTLLARINTTNYLWLRWFWTGLLSSKCQYRHNTPWPGGISAMSPSNASSGKYLISLQFFCREMPPEVSNSTGVQNTTEQLKWFWRIRSSKSKDTYETFQIQEYSAINYLFTSNSMVFSNKGRYLVWCVRTWRGCTTSVTSWPRREHWSEGLWFVYRGGLFVFVSRRLVVCTV